LNDISRKSSEYQTIEVGPINCIYEKTKILTKDGLKCAEDIFVGDQLLQPCGKTSKVNKITQTLIPIYGKKDVVLTKNDARLFKYKNTIITYWHKILVGDSMILPVEHSDFKELVDSELRGNAKVFNFQLDSFEHFIITEDNIILESLFF
jgi:hypothetical protein